MMISEVDELSRRLGDNRWLLDPAYSAVTWMRFLTGRCGFDQQCVLDYLSQRTVDD